MSMYDMHSYSYPSDGIIGLASSAGWGYPRWDRMLMTSGERFYVDQGTVSQSTHSPSSTSDRQGGFLGNLMKIFQRQNSSKASQKEDKDNNNCDTNAGNDAESDDINVATTGVPAAEADHAYALSLLFEEAATLLEESGNVNDCDSDENPEDSCPAMTKCPYLQEMSGNSDSELSYPGSETPPQDEHIRSRKIKFADDEGLPLEVIIEYEREESDEEEGGVQKKLKNLRKLKGTSRARRKHLKGVGEYRLTIPPKPVNTYQRYYKSYNEEYESKRIQAAGAFSMVGF